jgi:hypothetical protein
MAESKRQEHRRLQKRTDVLKEEHAALGRDRKPFDKGEHDAHQADLKTHQKDLARHRKRKTE